jgi:hypothetical protein
MGENAMADEKQGRLVAEYLHAPNVRGFTSADLAKSGLQGHDDIWWNSGNNWRRYVDELDLPEELVPVLLSRENGFQLLEETKSSDAEEEPAE